jgi:YD repeat-containing protein
MTGTSMASAFAFSYDAQDRLVERQQDGNVSRFAYNSAGDLIHSDLYGGPDTVYTYDAAGNLTQIGDRQTFTYDAAGRVLTEDYHSENGSIFWTYTYNESGGLISVSSVLPSGSTDVYTYDGAGHQLRYVCHEDGKDAVVNTYTWNGAGQLVRAAAQSTNSTVVNTLSYDKAGNCTYRLEKKQSSLGGVVSAESTATTYTYSAAGKLTCAPRPTRAPIPAIPQKRT